MAKFCQACKILVAPTTAGDCPKCGGALSSGGTPPPAEARIANPPGDPHKGADPAAPPPLSEPVPEARTSALAIASLVCGICGILITGIPAIITGHLGLGAIRRSRGALKGTGMAIAGLILGYVLLVLALLALASPLLFRNLKRVQMATALENARQIKSAMDDFSGDFDGQYPNEDTAEAISVEAAGPSYSNDYFRQLHLGGYTRSESIFWVNDSTVTGKQPDDFIGAGSKPNMADILKPGDVHWAYVRDQVTHSDPRRPIILDSFRKGTWQFDEDLWNWKVLVVRIDGSAKAKPMERADRTVLDSSGFDILSPEADAWKQSGESPEALLTQPTPR